MALRSGVVSSSIASFPLRHTLISVFFLIGVFSISTKNTYGYERFFHHLRPFHFSHKYRRISYGYERLAKNTYGYEICTKCFFSISAKNTYGYEICPKCLNIHDIFSSYRYDEIHTDMKFALNASIFTTFKDIEVCVLKVQ